MTMGFKSLLIPLLLPSRVLSLSVDLGGGVITRTNGAQLLANLALDVRDIREADDQEDKILRLYLDGRNAEEAPGLYFPLKKLSDKMSDESSVTTPSYLFHLYGLADLSVDNTKNSRHYSDRFIRTTITSTTDLTADAIVALDMWMYATHVLYKGIALCSKRAAADNPDRLEELGGGGMDEFIALWIGAEQTPASTEGHSLYAWAQEAGNLFGTNNPEAKVNEDLKLLYQQGAGVLSLPHACTKEGDSTGVRQLWNVAQQMISKMLIPQLQMLIHSLMIEDDDLAALYAMAVVPQVSQCQPSVFKRLKDDLMNGKISFGKKKEILNDIEAAIDCFGLTCDDIGTYREGTYACNLSENEGAKKALAGYQPATNVNWYSRLDRDILHLRILTSLDSWDFARYTYYFGRNSLKERDSDNDGYYLVSLHELAVAADRKRANPLYSYYVAYFNQVNYANNAVDQALRGVGKWTTKKQRVEVIAATCAYQIIFLYMIAELQQTVQQCRDPDFVLEQSLHPWDEVAALLVGSLEGPGEGGSSDLADGQLIFNLGNSRAFQFQTLTEEGYSQVNADLEDLLFAGKGELDALDCDNLERTAQRIEKLVVVPLVQSALRYAVLLENHSKDDGSAEAALGEIFSFAVLPILSAADAASAEVIRENMEVKKGVSPVRDGPQEVADAFGAAVVAWDLECPNLGYTPVADPCRLQGGHSEPRRYPRSSGNCRQASLLLAVCVAFSILVFF